MPRVVGLRTAAAADRIYGRGLCLTRLTEVHDTPAPVGAGRVARQSPPPGTRLRRDGGVRIRVEEQQGISVLLPSTETSARCPVPVVADAATG